MIFPLSPLFFYSSILRRYNFKRRRRFTQLSHFSSGVPLVNESVLVWFSKQRPLPPTPLPLRSRIDIGRIGDPRVAVGPSRVGSVPDEVKRFKSSLKTFSNIWDQVFPIVEDIRCLGVCDKYNLPLGGCNHISYQ